MGPLPSCWGRPWQSPSPLVGEERGGCPSVTCTRCVRAQSTRCQDCRVQPGGSTCYTRLPRQSPQPGSLGSCGHLDIRKGRPGAWWLTVAHAPSWTHGGMSVLCPLRLDVSPHLLAQGSRASACPELVPRTSPTHCPSIRLSARAGGVWPVMGVSECAEAACGPAWTRGSSQSCSLLPGTGQLLS